MTLNKKLLIKTPGGYVVPVLAIASLLVSCIIISSKKFFWMDELFSYYLLGDPSFNHMMVAFSDKFNNTPPLYFLIGWLWAKVFSSTELSLRLFSSLGICIACATVWITLRRTYGFWSASIGTLGVFCVSDIILSQNAEARMYGLFLAVCSLGLLQFDTLGRKSKCSWSIIILNICIHVAIVQTHLFGLFYSGAIVFALIVLDRYFKVFRPKIYLATVLSWLSLIPYIPAFLNQADAGNPRSWLQSPSLKDLIDLFSLSSSLSFFSIFILLFLILISGVKFIYQANPNRIAQESEQNYQNERAKISLLIFAYSFLLVPIFVWMVSRTIKPIFFDRYMIPSTLSWSILLAYLSSCIFEASSNHPIISARLIFLKNSAASPIFILLLILIPILLIQPISYAKIFSKEQLPGLNDNKYGYKDLPIVAQFSHDFIRRFHYSPEKNRYFFILDWQAALDSRSGRFPPQEYKTMDALKRNYPDLFQDNILKSEVFLKKYNQFLVLDYLDNERKCTLEDFHCSRWLDMRIMISPYKLTNLGKIDSRKLLLVEKR